MRYNNMNHKRIILLLLNLMLVAPLPAQRLHYDRPARYFEEALVIGNGTLGGTIYSNTRCDRISLNDITLWTGEPNSDQPDSAANATALKQIRQALNNEDYARANELQKQLQGHYSENYQPLGQLTMRHRYYLTKMAPSDDPDVKTNKYSRWLDISEATAGCSYTFKKSEIKKDYFCSYPDQVMVVRLRSNKPISIGLKMDSQLPHSVSIADNELIVDGYAAYHSLPHYTYQEQMFWYDSTRGTHFRTIVKVLVGEVTARTTETMTVRGEKEIVLLIANATSFNGFDKDPVKEGADYKTIVRKHIDDASKYTYSQLLSRHKKDYKKYFDRVELELGKTPRRIAKLPTDEQLRRYTDLEERNPDLEELYFQFGRYLLISSSRTPGVPATLQGLWNESVLPPWSSNYTTNINLEENYWPAEVANLSEMHMPLMQFMKNLQSSGRQTAKDYYGVNSGWCLAHNTDIWAMTNPVGLQSGDPSWANWNMGGAWLSTHIWEHYRYSRDTAFLREYYPVLKGAAEFCIEWLQAKDSLLLTMPSTSPENYYKMPDGTTLPTLYGGTADMAMIRECLTDAIEAAQQLRYDDADPFRSKAQQALAKLPAYKVGNRGNLQEWYHDWEDADPTHRHQSHLYGLYPGHSIHDYDTKLLAACAKTLEIKGTETTGWSTGWRINLYARLHDGEKAYQTYRRLLRYVSPDGYQGPDARRGGGTYPNLMDAHSPFQIDGNFGGTAGVCEMLVTDSTARDWACGISPRRCWPIIRHTTAFLPALPKAWKKGHAKGLRASDGATYDIYWKNGRLTRKKKH